MIEYLDFALMKVRANILHRTTTRRLAGDAHRRTFAERQAKKEQKPSEMKRVRARTSVAARTSAAKISGTPNVVQAL